MENKGMSRSEILDTAKKCVCGDREQDYGSPESSLRMIADLWEPYIQTKCADGAEITLEAEDVAAMMCLFKVARIATGHGKADNWIDCAGYAAIGGEIETNKESTAPIVAKEKAKYILTCASDDCIYDPQYFPCLEDAKEHMAKEAWDEVAGDSENFAVYDLNAWADSAGHRVTWQIFALPSEN